MTVQVLLKLLIIIFLMGHIDVYADNPLTLYTNAKASYYEDNLELAIDYLKRSLTLNPNYIEALELLSRINFDLKNYEYAFDTITKAISIAPERTDLILFSAEIEICLKRFSLAEKKLKNILSQDPLNMRAFNGLADIYLLTERNVLAHDTLQGILKSDPYNADALLKLSDYYMYSHPDKAESYYRLNIQNNSLNDTVYFKYSAFNFANGHVRDALDLINTALEIKKNPQYDNYKAKYLLHLKTPDQALTIYKDLIKDGTPDSLLYYNTARAYTDLSDTDQALLYLSKSLSLRPDDEVSAFFIDKLLITHYQVDYSLRIKRAQYYFQKALEAKKSAYYDLYMYYLRNAIMLNPSEKDARYELGSYYKTTNFPERYLDEMSLVYKITGSKDIRELIDMESRNLGYRLGNEWKVNQYNERSEVIEIPLFVKSNINNYHYDVESVYAELLKNLSYGKYKYEFIPYTGRTYTASEKMQEALTLKTPYFMDLSINEIDTMIDVTLTLYNAYTSDPIDTYKTFQFGNDKLIMTSAALLRKIDVIIPFKAKILKISQDRALINAGRRHGVKLKDTYYIIRNKKYMLEKGKTNYSIDREDIKGTAVVVKVDENISEIKYKDIDSYKDIDAGDLLIDYKK